MPPHLPLGPGSHIEVTRVPARELPAVWRRRAVQASTGLAMIAGVSWWFGFTAVGILIAGGAAVFLALPGTRLRMTNSVAAHRQERWVSPPINRTDDTRRHLLVIDRRGLELVPGTVFDPSSPPAPQFPWDEITAIRLEGPPGRPLGMQIETGSGVTAVTGQLPSAVLDELARYGVRLPQT